MGTVKRDQETTSVEEEEQAEVDIWKYIFGFVDTAVVKCAIELGIADAIESHGCPMTLSELSSALGCAPSPSPPLYRIMRFLTHRGIFEEIKTTDQGSSKAYGQTPLSRRLMRGGEKSMAALLLLDSNPEMMAPYHALSKYVLDNKTSPFEIALGEELWRFASASPVHAELINNAMSCSARLTAPAIIKGCPEVFQGLGSLVDVGGGKGTALSILVKAFPWIRGISFDLPHVVAVAPECDGVEIIGGSMFDGVPKADAAFLMWVLHDWGDEECIQILKNCREAIPKDKGKVIIVEVVIEEVDSDNKFKDVGLLLDIGMMAHTNTGRERTLKEWTYIFDKAGFTRRTVKSICAVQSVIEVYP